MEATKKEGKGESRKKEKEEKERGENNADNRGEQREFSVILSLL